MSSAVQLARAIAARPSAAPAPVEQLNEPPDAAAAAFFEANAGLDRDLAVAASRWMVVCPTASRDPRDRRVHPPGRDGRGVEPQAARQAAR